MEIVYRDREEAKEIGVLEEAPWWDLSQRCYTLGRYQKSPSCRD